MNIYYCYYAQLPQLNCVFVANKDLDQYEMQNKSSQFMIEHLSDFLDIKAYIARGKHMEVSKISVDEVPEDWRSVLLYHDGIEEIIIIDNQIKVR